MIKAQRNKRDLKELGCIIAGIVIALYVLLAYLAFGDWEPPINLSPIEHPTPRLQIVVPESTPSE